MQDKLPIQLLSVRVILEAKQSNCYFDLQTYSSKRLSSALIAVSKRHVESNNNLIAVYKVVVNVCHKTVINKRD